jgi:hypothetical protein
MTVDPHIIGAANDQVSEFGPSSDVEAWDHSFMGCWEHSSHRGKARRFMTFGLAVNSADRMNGGLGESRGCCPLNG